FSLHDALPIFIVAGDLNEMHITMRHLYGEIGEFLVSRNDPDIGLRADVFYFFYARKLLKKCFRRVLDPRVSVGRFGPVSEVAGYFHGPGVNRFDSVVDAEDEFAL